MPILPLVIPGRGLNAPRPADLPRVDLSRGGGSGADGRVISFPAAAVDGVPCRDVRIVVDRGRIVALSYRRGDKTISRPMAATDFVTVTVVVGELPVVTISQHHPAAGGASAPVTIQPDAAVTGAIDDGFSAALRRAAAILEAGPIPAAAPAAPAAPARPPLVPYARAPRSLCNP